KEAVVVFEERVLIGEIFSPSPKLPFTLPKKETRSWKPTYSPQPSWKSYSSSQETKEESPSLLDTSLKKLKTELEEIKKELKLLKDKESGIEVALAFLNAELHKNMSKIAKAETTEAAKKVAALKSSTNMANVVSSGVGWKKTTEKKVTKKKPIIPLLGDLFSKKKGKSNASVSRSTLKRVCRGLGISWWPFKNDKIDFVLKPNHTDVVIHASDRTATPVLGTSIESSGPTNIYVPVNLTEHDGLVKLEELVATRFKLSPGSFRLKYADADGYMILIAYDSDLKGSIESVLDDLIQSDGWLQYEGTFALDTFYYGEYANSGLRAVMDMRVKWKGFK
ncbi:WEB family protein-like protein, partial [Tanacetum coccineum]